MFHVPNAYVTQRLRDYGLPILSKLRVHWRNRASWTCRFRVCIKFRKFSPLFYLEFSIFLPLRDSNCLCMKPLKVVLFRFSLFIFFLSLHFILDSSIAVTSALLVSSYALSNLQLIPSGMFFISDIVVLIPSIWLGIFILSVPLFIFFNIWNIVNKCFNILVGDSNISVTSGLVLIDWLFSLLCFLGFAFYVPSNIWLDVRHCEFYFAVYSICLYSWSHSMIFVLGCSWVAWKEYASLGSVKKMLGKSTERLNLGPIISQ